jgi:hypothetical protein
MKEFYRAQIARVPTIGRMAPIPVNGFIPIQIIKQLLTKFNAICVKTLIVHDGPFLYYLRK